MDTETNRRLTNIETTLVSVVEALQTLVRVEERVAAHNENHDRLARKHDNLDGRVQKIEQKVASREYLVRWGERAVWGFIVLGAAAAVNYFQ